MMPQCYARPTAQSTPPKARADIRQTAPIQQADRDNRVTGSRSFRLTASGAVCQATDRHLRNIRRIHNGGAGCAWCQRGSFINPRTTA